MGMVAGPSDLNCHGIGNAGSPPTGFVTISQHAHNTGLPPVTATRAPEI